MAFFMSAPIVARRNYEGPFTLPAADPADIPAEFGCMSCSDCKRAHKRNMKALASGQPVTPVVCKNRLAVPNTTDSRRSSTSRPASKRCPSNHRSIFRFFNEKVASHGTPSSSGESSPRYSSEEKSSTVELLEQASERLARE